MFMGKWWDHLSCGPQHSKVRLSLLLSQDEEIPAKPCPEGEWDVGGFLLHALASLAWRACQSPCAGDQGWVWEAKQAPSPLLALRGW